METILGSYALRLISARLCGILTMQHDSEPADSLRSLESLSSETKRCMSTTTDVGMG